MVRAAVASGCLCTEAVPRGSLGTAHMGASAETVRALTLSTVNSMMPLAGAARMRQGEKPLVVSKERGRSAGSAVHAAACAAARRHRPRTAAGCLLTHPLRRAPVEARDAALCPQAAGGGQDVGVLAGGGVDGVRHHGTLDHIHYGTGWTGPGWDPVWWERQGVQAPHSRPHSLHPHAPPCTAAPPHCGAPGKMASQ